MPQRTTLLAPARLLIALLIGLAPAQEHPVSAADGPRVLFPIRAESGDKAYGVAFDGALFDQQRQEQKAAYEAPRGFAWYPIRPQLLENEKEEAFAKRLADHEQSRREDPWELEGLWVWFPERFWNPDAAPRPGFSSDDIETVRRSIDTSGGRAVTIEVKEDKQAFLVTYSRDHVRRDMVIIAEGEVWSWANIKIEFSDSIQITRGAGGYSEAEQDFLLAAFGVEPDEAAPDSEDDLTLPIMGLFGAALLAYLVLRRLAGRGRSGAESAGTI